MRKSRLAGLLDIGNLRRPAGIAKTSCDIRRRTMTQKIVPPEPYSKVKLEKSWEYIPRWLQIVIFTILIAAGALILFLTR
jgi:hypothetical protein